MTLAQAPASVRRPSGSPAFGTFSGHVPFVRWGTDVHSPLWTALHRKRWHYASIAGPRCVLGLAVIDVGWATSAFVYLYDRRERRLLSDLSFLGVPWLSAQVSDRPGEGADSKFIGPTGRISLTRPVGSKVWRVRARGASGFLLEAELDASVAPASLCAIARIDGGLANCTHKTVSLPVHGFVEVNHARIDLSGSWGALDHTNGLLARDTVWHWASISGERVGLNLVEGFNGPSENAVWLDGKLIPVGAAEFRFDPKAPLVPWIIRTRDGLVDLLFTPEAARREDKNFIIAKSRFIQPIGTFTGRILSTHIDGLPGVTEDHLAKW